MYAIIELGGKQYQVEKGQKVDVEDCSYEEGKEYINENVLLTSDEGKITIGKPYVKDAQVKFTVKSLFLDKKTITFKKKPKKRYENTKGHRQHLAEIEILEVSTK